MQSIDLDQLSNVRGGEGLLGTALQAAPGILDGIAGIISAAKGGGQQAPAAAPVDPGPRFSVSVRTGG
jgi:hypothetical protein